MTVVRRRRGGGPNPFETLPQEIVLKIMIYVGPGESRKDVRDQAAFASAFKAAWCIYQTSHIGPARRSLRDEQNGLIMHSVKVFICRFFTTGWNYFSIFGCDSWPESHDANWRPRKYTPGQWATFLESAKSNLRRWTYHPLQSDGTLIITSHQDIMLFHKAAMKFARSIRRRQLRLARKNAAIAVA